VALRLQHQGAAAALAGIMQVTSQLLPASHHL